MRKTYSILFLITFITLLILPYTFLFFPSVDAQSTTGTYYLNAGDSFLLLCPNSQSALGSLDSVSFGPSSIGLTTDSSTWNTFCASLPILNSAQLQITSVRLTMFLCCDSGRTRYSILPELIDTSTSPETVLASPIGPFHVAVDGISCQSPTKVTFNIPVTPGANLTSGQTLLLEFQIGGPQPVTICTGKGGVQNTPSLISITGAPPVTTTTSTTESASTTSSDSSTTTLMSASSSSTVHTSTTVIVHSESETDSSSQSTTISSVTNSATSSAPPAPPPSRFGSFLPDLNNSFLIAGLVAGIVVIASAVIALGGRKS